ncbi:MAG: ArsR family transcriptional regulator [Nitrososphaerota archaeon]
MGHRRKAWGEPQDGEPPHEVVAKAANHPARAKALAILTERVASSKEISAELEVPLSSISYHLSVLDDLGLVEVVGEEARGGSVVAFYRAVERTAS